MSGDSVPSMGSDIIYAELKKEISRQSLKMLRLKPAAATVMGFAHRASALS